MSRRGPTTLDHEDLLAAIRRMHEAVRRSVGELLERARLAGRPELANAPGSWQAGDLIYALDEPAEAALEAFGEELGRRHPLVLIAEGPGERRHGAGASGAPLRVLVDPVDGTRSLMHDMRSAWVLTGLAPDRGAQTRLSDCEVAVQTELPTTWAGVYHVLTAIRGRGATIARHDVRSGRELDRRPLSAGADARLDNGYLCFTRYLPVERPLVAALEERFLQRAIDEHGLQARLIYDDQYLCSAGQLYLVATGRYRMLADLRGWLARRHGLDNFTSKPYDVSALLVYREAGIPVLDASFRPLDAPFDTSTPLDLVAFPNEAVRALLEPILQAAMEADAPDG